MLDLVVDSECDVFLKFDDILFGNAGIAENFAFMTNTLEELELDGALTIKRQEGSKVGLNNLWSSTLLSDGSVESKQNARIAITASVPGRSNKI